MAKRRSWSFDAEAFNTWLIGEIVEDDRIRLDRYRNLTQRIVDKASGEGRQYLETLVVDEEDFADDGSIHLDKWYAACMANHLTRGPSGDHIMLAIPVLTVAKWSDDDIDSMVTGDHLATLVERSNGQALRREIAPYVRDRRYGGWLSPERAADLQERLGSIGNLFERPTPDVLNRYPGDLRDLRGLLLESFREATTVLRFGLDHGLSTRILTRF